MSAGHGHDAWHQHTTAEGAPQHEHGAHASAKALGLTFIVMVVGVIATILILVAYFKSFVSQYKAERQEGTAMMAPTFEAKLAARNRLGSYGWVDRDAGTVHIPLDAAMQRVLSDYQKNTASKDAAATDAQG